MFSFFKLNFVLHTNWPIFKGTQTKIPTRPMSSVNVVDAINLDDLIPPQHTPSEETVRGVQLSGLG